MIKRFLFLTLMLICTCSISPAKDCEYYTCSEPYDMNSKFRSAVGAISGLNFTSEKVAQSVLKKDIAKTIKSRNLKVKLDSYTAKDLKNGIFKSLTVSGDDVYTEGIYLSHIKMKTLCDFNYIQESRDGGVIFREDFPMSFEFKMTEEDINKTLESERYKRVINGINKFGLGGIKITDTRVEIRNNHFFYIIYVRIPITKSEKRIIIGADVVVENGKIDYSKAYLTSNSVKFDLSKADYILDYLNPLNFSVNILRNKNAKVYVENLKISGDTIKTDGIFVIPKS